MNTRDEKLDYLVEKLSEIHTDLQVHIAKDEGMWHRVAETEDEIKELTKDAGRLKAKHAALVATIATVLSGGITTITRFLP
jgi:hypothetical protein